MRAWDKIVGWTVGVVGSLLWAVSLAIYQRRMEPSGFWRDPADGGLHPNLGSNNTYWPRDVRELAILLAVAGLIAVGRSSVRAVIVAATLGVAWFGADIWLDRIDIDGSSAMVLLAGAGCAAVTVAAVAVGRGSPSERISYLAASTAVVLASVPLSITNPWNEPLTEPDEIRINHAIKIMDAVLSVALLAVAVALVARMMRTARSRWLVPAGALVAAMGFVLLIVLGPGAGAGWVLLVLVAIPVALVGIATAWDVSDARLARIGGSALLLLPCSIFVLFSLGTWLGGQLTALAANPPINSADEDIAQPPTMALIGLGIAAVSLWLSGIAGRPQPVEDEAVAGLAS